MQQSLGQLLYNLAAYITQPHDGITQLTVATVFSIGLIMVVLWLVFPLRSQEPDWQADLPPWPMQDAASAESRGQGPATGGGKHMPVLQVCSDGEQV